MTAVSLLALLALLALIGWLVWLQTVRVGHDQHVRLSRRLLLTTSVLVAVAAALVLPNLYSLVT
jgi:hypothetical protein